MNIKVVNELDFMAVKVETPVLCFKKGGGLVPLCFMSCNQNKCLPLDSSYHTIGNFIKNLNQNLILVKIIPVQKLHIYFTVKT